MASSYLSLLRGDPRLLVFGWLLALASSFGQTFYIALYAGEVRADFGLSHGGFGGLYSAATLSSGLLLMWLGRLIDVVDLRLYSAVIVVGLALGCLVFGFAASPLLLGVGIFLLRLFGQGLLSHAAATTMARYFAQGARGKAISLAVLGHPLGEAVLPLASVVVVAAVGWRQAWFLTAVLIAVLVLPLTLWLLRGHAARHHALLARTATPDGEHRAMRQWTRAEVARDPRFYVAMAAMLSPSFIVTGLFFHQVHLVETKGWPLVAFAASFAVYAAMQVLVMAACGPLVDRVGGRRLTTVYLLPMAAGLVVLAQMEQLYAAPLFMAAVAVTEGVAASLMSILWVELYGVVHLGAIRAMVFGLSVIASALSPAALGWLLDAGVSMQTLLMGGALYALLGSIVLGLLFGGRRPP